MGDTVVLIIGVLTPLSLILCLRTFVRRRRRRTGTVTRSALVLGNSLVLLLILSLLFLAGECYFRYWYDATDSFSETRTGRLWYSRHFHRNTAGFRDNIEYAFDLKPDLPRVSFIGDSFTAGHGIANVEDRFANRVRRMKRGQWEVHVLAESGRDTGAEIKLVSDLRRERYQFDTIVLVYCLNDISDIVTDRNAPAVDAVPQRTPWLIEHSFLINTLYYRLRARFDPAASHYYEFVRTAYDGPTWQEQQSRLIEFDEQCREAGGRLEVVLFPLVHVVAADHDYRRIHEGLNQFWRDRDVPCLDLLPMYEQHAGETLTVSRYDAHPNERAHELAADAILEWLEGLAK